MLLAIDTATRLMSLALHDGHNLIAEQTWHTDKYHSTELAPAIQSTMAACDVDGDDLTAIAVTIGPGSFTGLRVGVSLAKGLASAHGLPLVGVPTLDVLAAGQPHHRSGLIAVVQAGRGRIIAATYHWRQDRWLSRNEPRLMDWESLLENIDGPARVAGEIDETGIKAINAAQDRDIPVALVASGFSLRRAGFLATEALLRLEENSPKAFEPARVAPLYIKTQDTP